jgi:hypothetical protein
MRRTPAPNEENVLFALLKDGGTTPISTTTVTLAEDHTGTAGPRSPAAAPGRDRGGVPAGPGSRPWPA